MLHADTRLEASDESEPMIASKLKAIGIAAHNLRLHHHGNPEVHRERELRPHKLLRGDADDRVCQPVQVDGFPDHRRVRSEAPLPEAVAQYNDRMSARSLVFFGKEGAPEKRTHAQHVEIVAGHNLAPDDIV